MHYCIFGILNCFLTYVHIFRIHFQLKHLYLPCYINMLFFSILKKWILFWQAFWYLISEGQLKKRSWKNQSSYWRCCWWQQPHFHKPQGGRPIAKNLPRKSRRKVPGQGNKVQIKKVHLSVKAIILRKANQLLLQEEVKNLRKRDGHLQEAQP